MRSRKTPSTKVEPSRPPKEPLVETTVHSGQTLRFSFLEIDTGGDWPLHKARTTELPRLVKKLRMLESITASDALRNHILSRIDMGSCPNKAAARRLTQQYQGLDVLHEIRVEPSQDGRLFGRLVGRFFNIIWWDPRHEVWPEGKVKR